MGHHHAERTLGFALEVRATVPQLQATGRPRVFVLYPRSHEPRAYWYRRRARAPKHHSQLANQPTPSSLENVRLNCFLHLADVFRKNNGSSTIIDQVFGGEVENRIVCCQCGAQSITKEAFLGMTMTMTMTIIASCSLASLRSSDRRGHAYAGTRLATRPASRSSRQIHAKPNENSHLLAHR